MEQLAVKDMQSYQAQLDRQKFMVDVEKKNYQNVSQMHEVEQ